MYLPKSSVVLPILPFINPLLWHVVVLLIANLYRAQQTLRGESLGTNCCLKIPFIGLLVKEDKSIKTYIG